MSPSDDIFYVLECTVQNCKAEFYVNDFPIERRGQDWGYFYGAPVNEYILKGQNTISVVINPGPSPGRALSGTDSGRQRSMPHLEANVSLKLGTYPRGAVVGGPDCRDLVSIEWKPGKERSHFFPLVFSAAVDIDPPFGPWAWQQFPRVELDDATRQEIDTFIKEIHTAFAGAMPEPFIDAAQPRFSDGEQSNFLPAGERQGQAETMLPKIMGRLSWGMQPLDGIEPDLRLCAEGKMGELIAKDWQPVLRSIPEEESEAVYYFAMMVSKVDGEWQVIR